MLLAVVVHPAGDNDSQWAARLLERIQGHVPRLEAVLADQGYAAVPTMLVWRVSGWLWQVVKRNPVQKGFVVVRRRWVVERTFAWFGGYRRLSKDYEALPAVSAAMAQLAAIRLMSRRLR